MRELEWKQAEMARTLINRMMSDEGWQAMTMLDWEEGRTYAIAPGMTVRILQRDVPAAIEAALRANGPKRTETQRAENSTIESRQFFESLDAWRRCMK